MTSETDQILDADQQRKSVSESYAKIAGGAANAGCCLPAMDQSGDSGCCGPSTTPSAEAMAKAFGYSDQELMLVPEGANMGLGCGNPSAIAAMQPGEVVLDLGAGGGFDCFLAGRQVGDTGRVIGVDMTPDMLRKARANADKMNMPWVEFRLGEIEHLPVGDDSVDVIISNCVVNLSPAKSQVIKDCFRVLKSGGRLAISDVVRTKDFPDDIATDIDLLCGCVSGAASVDQLERWLRAAGFDDIKIDLKPESLEGIAQWAPGRGIENYVISASIEARKPKGNSK